MLVVTTRVPSGENAFKDTLFLRPSSVTLGEHVSVSQTTADYFSAGATMNKPSGENAAGESVLNVPSRVVSRTP